MGIFLTVVNIFGVITILELIEIKLLFNRVYIVLESDKNNYCRFLIIIDYFPLKSYNIFANDVDKFIVLGFKPAHVEIL